MLEFDFVVIFANVTFLFQNLLDTSSPERGLVTSPSILSRLLANSSPIHAATPQTAQQPIISMEDDEISDPEVVSSKKKSLYTRVSHFTVFTN